jgi:hypothetical protein
VYDVDWRGATSHQGQARFKAACANAIFSLFDKHITQRRQAKSISMYNNIQLGFGVSHVIIRDALGPLFGH